MKKKIILSAIMSICLCASLIAGATFAIFTSESKVNIAVTSGKVEVIATIPQENVKISSLDNIDMKTFEGTEIDRTAEGTFLNGGTATLNGDTLTLDRLTPGDKVSFKINVKNESNVKILYRYGYEVEALDGHSADEAKLLYSALQFKLEEIVTKDYVSYYTKWTTFENDASLDVEVGLPAETTNKYQGLAGKIVFKLEAVQGNAEVEDGDGEKFEVATKEGLLNALEAINNATDISEKKITVADNFVFEDETLAIKKGDVTLDLGGKELTITSGDKNGILVENGAALTIDGGNGKLNVESGSGHAIDLKSTADSEESTSLTIKNAKIDIENNASTKAVVYAYAEDGEKNIEVNVESGAEINIKGARNFGAFQLANNAVMNMNGGVINAEGVGSVIVAGRNDAGIDADDIFFNFNGGTININGGKVIAIECNYFATATMNGGTINITGDNSDSYAVGASFGGYIYINGGEINVKATSGSAYAIATYGNHSAERKSTVTIGEKAVINLGSTEYNGLSDLYPYTVLIDNRA